MELLKLHMERLKLLDEQIDKLSQEVAKVLQKHQDAVARLARLRDPSVASLPLAKIDATKYDLPSSAVKLTRAEKKLLEDPDWITEDEADFTLALRELKRDKSKAIPLRGFLEAKWRPRGALKFFQSRGGQ